MFVNLLEARRNECAITRVQNVINQTVAVSSVTLQTYYKRLY